MYEEEVKRRFFDLLDEKQIEVQVDNYLTLDDSIKSIFRYYEERHCTDWKSWMIQVKKIAKDQLQFCIVRDLQYDGAKCYDFAQTI